MWDRPARPYLLLLPALVTLGALFLGGLAGALQQSLGILPALGRLTPTLEHHLAVLTAPAFRAEFGLSLYIAGVSTLLSCIGGLGLAATLAAAPSRVTLLLTRLPLAVSHTVTAYLALLWLSQSGLLARLVYRMGLITAPAEFPALVNDPGAVGTIAAYVWKEAPFAALMLYPVILAVSRQYMEVAATLGASPLHRWRLVMLPLLAPALAAVALTIFCYTFGAYELPYLLGQTFPRSLPVAAVERFHSPDLHDRPEAMVYNMVITAVTLLAAWLYLRRFTPERRPAT